MVFGKGGLVLCMDGRMRVLDRGRLALLVHSTPPTAPQHGAGRTKWCYVHSGLESSKESTTLDLEFSFAQFGNLTPSFRNLCLCAMALHYHPRTSHDCAPTSALKTNQPVTVTIASMPLPASLLSALQVPPWPPLSTQTSPKHCMAVHV